MDPRPDRPNNRGYRLPPERYDLGQPGPGLTLYAPIGGIRVRSAAVAVLDKVLTVSAPSEAAALELASGCRVALRRGTVGDTIVELAPPRGTLVDAVGADFLLALPDGLDLDLRTRDGLIDAVRHAPRRAELETVDGVVLAGDVAESLRVRTNSGRIELSGEFQSAHVTSHSGSLEVGIWRAGCSLDFRSHRGSCTLIAPSGAPVEVVFRTRQGRTINAPPSVPVSTGDGWIEHRLVLPGTAPFAPAAAVVETDLGDLVITDTSRG